MPTVNERIYNGIVRHQIGLMRYSTATVREIIILLNRSQVAVIDAIRRYDVESGSAVRLQALLGALREIDAEAGRVMAGALDEDLADLADMEALWIERLMNGALPAAIPIAMNIASPTAEQLYAAVHSRPFEGNILREYYERMPDTLLRPVKEALTQGYAIGRTTDQLIRDIRGSRANNYTDGLLQQSRRSVEKLVRTAVNHTATTAREEVYKNNEDLVSGIRWVSTLDMRTSEICMSLDGQLFDPGEGPRPPAHWNCRSTTTPIVKSWKELGFNVADLDPGTRASMDGQVPATETYQTWLEKQPKDVQDEALGPEKAQMFRDGMKLDRFVADGRTLTLEQLRELN